MDNCKKLIQTFRKEHGWDVSDTPCILAKSIFVEAAELLECYKDEEQVNRDAAESELADVLMYALSLCYDLQCDPAKLIAKKMEDVNKRYPKVTK